PNPLQPGISLIRGGLASYLATGTRQQRTYFLALPAESLNEAGRVSEGIAVLAETQALVEKNEERYWEAELHRLRGELWLREGAAAAEVEPWFHQASEVARRQQAKSLELRAVMSLSRLWQQQGKRAEARALLAEIYDWLIEGFDTPDLKEAKVLLDELS